MKNYKVIWQKQAFFKHSSEHQTFAAAAPFSTKLTDGKKDIVLVALADRSIKRIHL